MPEPTPNHMPGKEVPEEECTCSCDRLVPRSEIAETIAACPVHGSGKKPPEVVGEEAETHELKCWPPYFEDIRTGRKNFECRKADRFYAEGDTLRLREFDPEKGYTGRKLTRGVTYVLHGGAGGQFGIAPGHCVIALTQPAVSEVPGDDQPAEFTCCNWDEMSPETKKAVTELVEIVAAKSDPGLLSDEERATYAAARQSVVDARATGLTQQREVPGNSGVEEGEVPFDAEIHPRNVWVEAKGGYLRIMPPGDWIDFDGRVHYVPAPTQPQLSDEDREELEQIAYHFASKAAARRTGPFKELDEKRAAFLRKLASQPQQHGEVEEEAVDDDLRRKVAFAFLNRAPTVRRVILDKLGYEVPVRPLPSTAEEWGLILRKVNEDNRVAELAAALDVPTQPDPQHHVPTKGEGDD